MAGLYSIYPRPSASILGRLNNIYGATAECPRKARGVTAFFRYPRADRVSCVCHLSRFLEWYDISVRVLGISDPNCRPNPDTNAGGKLTFDGKGQTKPGPVID